MDPRRSSWEQLRDAAALAALFLALLVCALFSSARSAFPDTQQCPCPPKVVHKHKPAPKPRPAPTPSPTPTPWPPEERMFEEPVFEKVPRVFEEPAPQPTPTPTPSPTPSPEGMKASVLAGGLVSFGSGTDSGKLSPLARVAVNGLVPLPGIDATRCPRVLVSADFTALPGESATLQKLESFKALEFQVAVAQRVAPQIVTGDQRITFSLFATAGFATRLPGDTQPRDQSPRFGALGFRLDEWGSGSFLAVAISADQRLGGAGYYQPAVLIGGAVLLKEVSSGTLAGGRALLVGSAILGLNASYTGTTLQPRRDIVRVGIAIGR